MLLPQALRASTPKGDSGIVYVGGQLSLPQGSTVTQINFNLSGGTNTVPQVGDLVVVAYAQSTNIGDVTMSISGAFGATTTSAYTLIADLYANDSVDLNFSVGYKFMTATPDTGVIVQTFRYKAVSVHVWRNVNTTTPLDVTTTTSTRINTAIPLLPNITTVRDKCMVMTIGAGALSDPALNTFNKPTILNNWFTGYTLQQDTPVTVIGVGSHLKSPAGLFTAPTLSFATGTDRTTSSAAAVTLALRPA